MSYTYVIRKSQGFTKLDYASPAEALYFAVFKDELHYDFPLHHCLGMEEKILELLETLKEREQLVILFRYGFLGEFYTLDKIGGFFWLSRESIRNIEKKALRKLGNPYRRRCLKPRESDCKSEETKVQVILLDNRVANRYMNKKNRSYQYLLECVSECGLDDKYKDILNTYIQGEQVEVELNKGMGRDGLFKKYVSESLYFEKTQFGYRYKENPTTVYEVDTKNNSMEDDWPDEDDDWFDEDDDWYIEYDDFDEEDDSCSGN